MGYIYAATAIVGLSLLAITYKLSDRHECNKQQVNFFFLSSAAVLSIAWGGATARIALHPNAWVLGAAMGAVVYISVLAFREAVSRGRISTSWTVLNLSIIVPLLVCVLFWSERPRPWHWAGLALTVASVVLLGIDMQRSGE